MSTQKNPIVRARDVMHQGSIYINGMATAKEAAAKTREEGFTSLIVDVCHENDAWVSSLYRT